MHVSKLAQEGQHATQCDASTNIKYKVLPKQ